MLCYFCDHVLMYKYYQVLCPINDKNSIGRQLYEMWSFFFFFFIIIIINNTFVFPPHSWTRRLWVLWISTNGPYRFWGRHACLCWSIHNGWTRWWRYLLWCPREFSVEVATRKERKRLTPWPHRGPLLDLKNVKKMLTKNNNNFFNHSV